MSLVASSAAGRLVTINVAGSRLRIGAIALAAMQVAQHLSSCCTSRCLVYWVVSVVLQGLVLVIYLWYQDACSKQILQISHC